MQAPIITSKLSGCREVQVVIPDRPERTRAEDDTFPVIAGKRLIRLDRSTTHDVNAIATLLVLHKVWQLQKRIKEIRTSMKVMRNLVVTCMSRGVDRRFRERSLEVISGDQRSAYAQSSNCSQELDLWSPNSAQLLTLCSAEWTKSNKRQTRDRKSLTQGDTELIAKLRDGEARCGDLQARVRSIPKDSRSARYVELPAGYICSNGTMPSRPAFSNVSTASSK